MKRKDFITHSAIIGAGVLLLPDKLMAAKNKTSPKKARLAFIGVGMRGAG
jgi:hypothetical protein